MLGDTGKDVAGSRGDSHVQSSFVDLLMVNGQESKIGITCGVPGANPAQTLSDLVATPRVTPT